MTQTAFMVDTDMQPLSRAQSDLHYAHLYRTLSLVKVSRGKLTSTIARRLTGWNERSIQRYLNELQARGLVEHDARRSSPYHWSLTQAGEDVLSRVT